MNRVIVTTSWDDGHKLDLRLARLLKKYDIAGTFYIAPNCREITPNLRLTAKELKLLSKDFEIGSHTMTHPVMTTIPPEECLQELTESKRFLQAVTGQEITSFCYPRGAHSRQNADMVKCAGYTYARTVEGYIFDTPQQLLEAGTSLETHRLPIPRLAQSILQLGRYCRWQPRLILQNLSWEKRAKTMFDRVKAEGGVFHLWGHSWVIENEHGWAKLESVLRYIHDHTDVSYVTNAQLAKRGTAA